MFEHFFAQVTQRWLLSLLALVLITPLIWQLVPRIAIDGQPLIASPSARGWLIGLMFLFWLLYWGGRWLSGYIKISVTRRTNENGENSQADLSPSHDLSDIQEGFATARVLLSSREVRQLPRFLLLGEAGSGKHALMQHLPLGIKHHYALGTQADWYLGEEALVLSTVPGLASKAWRRLLRQLRQLRYRQPLNGVLLALSLPSLLETSEPSLTARAIQLRECLQSIQQYLGHGVPVYLLICQADRLTGFDAFFSRLTSAERAQILGFTFPLYPVGDASQILTYLPEAFHTLTRQLHERIIERLMTLPSMEERVRALAFPSQFESLYTRLEQFVHQLAHHSRYQADTLLRGVYFTSSPQPGQALSQHGKSLTQDPAPTLKTPMTPMTPGAYGYFVIDLWQRVILPEQRLAPHYRFGLRLHTGLKAAAIAALLIGGMMLAVWGVKRYRLENQRLLVATRADQTLNRVATHSFVADDMLSMLPLLNAARALTTLNASAWPAMMWYDTSQQLNLASDAQYHRLLSHTLQPYVLQQLIAAMRDRQSNFNQRYQALRVYLMLGSPTYFRPHEVLNWLKQHREPSLIEPRTFQQFLDHAHAWLYYPLFTEHLQLDPSPINETRASLLAAPLALQLFAGLKSQLTHQLPNQLSVAQLAGPSAVLVLKRLSGSPLSEGIDPLYTPAGFIQYKRLRDQQLIHPAELSWVLGTRVTPEQLATEKETLDQLYFTEYKQQWDRLLADVVLKPLTDLDDSGKMLKLFASHDSPLRQWLLGASKQTTLYPASPVDQHFAALHGWVTAAPGSKSIALDTVEAQLAEAAVYMDAVKSARDHGLPPPSSDALQKLQQTASSQPGPVGSLIAGLAQNNNALARKSQLQQLTQQWKSQVSTFCHVALDGRYPFKRTSQIDMTLSDFSKLFRPGGLIDGFFQKNLAALVDTTQQPWRARPLDASQLKLAAPTLAMFQQAAAIRDAFFPDGGQVPAAKFELVPLTMDAALTRLTLSIDGQNFNDTHGPQKPISLRWPGKDDSAGCRIDYAPAVNDKDEQTIKGPWCLFRLLDQGQLQTLRPDQYQLTFNQQGHTALVRLNAQSVTNPFNRRVLAGFACRDTL